MSKILGSAKDAITACSVMRWMFKLSKSEERKSKGHSFLVRRPTRRSRGRGVMLWPVSPSLIRPRPLARALGMTQSKCRASLRFANSNLIN